MASEQLMRTAGLAGFDVLNLDCAAKLSVLHVLKNA
jgi:hypothetical protein